MDSAMIKNHETQVMVGDFDGVLRDSREGVELVVDGKTLGRSDTFEGFKVALYALFLDARNREWVTKDPILDLLEDDFLIEQTNEDESRLAKWRLETLAWLAEITDEELAKIGVDDHQLFRFQVVNAHTETKVPALSDF